MLETCNVKSASLSTHSVSVVDDGRGIEWSSVHLPSLASPKVLDSCTESRWRFRVLSGSPNLPGWAICGSSFSTLNVDHPEA